MNCFLEIVIPILYYVGEVFGNCGLALSQRLYHQYRLYNYTILSMNVLGIQKCVSECTSRPSCRSVNFDTVHLSCELNWMSGSSLITMASGFIFVDMHNESSPEDECSQCSAGDRCVALSSGRKHCLQDKATDCTDIMKRGVKSGIYPIFVGRRWLNVLCDMDTDGGGWLIFQRRMDGKTNFYRSWTEYKFGFGSLSAEFWLGNDVLHHILQQGQYELRMDMSDFENASRYVKYQSVNIGNEASGYLMSISGYSGNVDDCFTNAMGINNMKFSTYDRDNDVYNEGACAINYKGCWWYEACHCANPNGLYLAGNNSQYAIGCVYRWWRGNNYSLKTIKIMIRRKV